MQPTAHARSRCQQRGIPPVVVDLIVDFGAEVRTHGAKRPMATVGFERADDAWRLTQVSGYANRPANGRVAAVARSIWAGSKGREPGSSINKDTCQRQ